jgi:DNA-binding CsgD family transcriptional regulator/5-methylcytosine-specific restriction endonuclease McrA
MLAAGASVPEVALALGLTRNTVAYHRDYTNPPAREIPDLRGSVGRVGTRERVQAMLADGLTQNEIARRLGITKSTVSYHVRRLGKPRDERGARRYDWAAVQSFYDLGHSVTECQRAFGFSRQSWNDAVKRGDVVSRPHALPVDQLLVAGARRSRFNLKCRLLGAGLKENRCELCGIDTWLGAPLSLALHHVNGDGLDNRLENLQLLCPNCHSQTENFSGRKMRVGP